MRRCCLGRKLVFSGRGPGPGTRTQQRGSFDELYLGDPPGAARHQITGANGQEIDHIELFGHSQQPGVNSKNFVLCPGKAYDRSPCGTGTSAKLACLYADGKLREGQVWKQESIVGSVFEGSIKVRDGQVHPSIKGSAFVNAEAEPGPRPARSILHGHSAMTSA